MVFRKLLKRFARDERGASLVEYAVALLVVVVVGLAGMQALGTNTKARITSATSAVAAPAP